MQYTLFKAEHAIWIANIKLKLELYMIIIIIIIVILIRIITFQIKFQDCLALIQEKLSKVFPFRMEMQVPIFRTQ